MVKKILIILLVLLATEIMLRIYQNVNGVKISTLYRDAIFKDTYFLMKSCSVIRQAERSGDIIYHFNREGFRDVDHREDCEAVRIVLLGDSVTMGLGVPIEKSYPYLLESGLNDSIGKDSRFDVVNLSMWAFGVFQEKKVLIDYGLKYRPDIVILQMSMNDFGAPQSMNEEKYSSISDYIQKKIRSFKNRCFEKSVLLMRIRQIALMGGRAIFRNARRKYFTNTLNQKELKWVEAYFNDNPGDDLIKEFVAIKEIKRIVEENNAEIILAIIPQEVQLFLKDYDAVNLRIAEFCKHNGIKLCDPLNVMRLRPDLSEVFLDGVHMSRIGNKIVADMLMNMLLENIKKGGGNVVG